MHRSRAIARGRATRHPRADKFAGVGGVDDLWVRVDASGRLVVPREMRDALGLPAGGGPLRLWVEDGELRGLAPAMALRRVQARVRALVPPGGPSLGDELRALRREEAARDDASAEAGTSSPPRPAPGGVAATAPERPGRRRRAAGA